VNFSTVISRVGQLKPTHCRNVIPLRLVKQTSEIIGPVLQTHKATVLLF